MAGPRRWIEHWPAAALGGLVVLVAAFWAYQYGLVRPSYPDAGLYPVRGIDVSHHNGAIAWRRLHDAGIRFAYLKASEGGDFRDGIFAANAQGAARVGVSAGAYHYFTLCRPGSEQARNFLAATVTARLRLPPAVDLEFGGNCADRPSRRAFNHELASYLEAVRAGTGREPVLYVTEDFHKAYLANSPFQRRTFWIRDLVGAMRAPAHARVRFWQYSAQGRVDGIEGPVDLNVFLGDEVAFRAMLAP